MSAPPAIDGAAPALRAPASFLGLPTGDLEDLRPGDIALVGLFLDHGDNRGFGARFAARQIRYASRPAFGMGARAPEVTGRHRGRLFDLGDLNVFPLEPPRQREALLRQFTALLSSGANIAEMNCVRKHLSRIKGGRLAAACAPARVVTLTISDVPGDDPSSISSANLPFFSPFSHSFSAPALLRKARGPEGSKSTSI
jgi:hypothetical protein